MWAARFRPLERWEVGHVTWEKDYEHECPLSWDIYYTKPNKVETDLLLAPVILRPVN